MLFSSSSTANCADKSCGPCQASMPIVTWDRSLMLCQVASDQSDRSPSIVGGDETAIARATRRTLASMGKSNDVGSPPALSNRYTTRYSGFGAPESAKDCQ